MKMFLLAGCKRPDSEKQILTTIFIIITLGDNVSVSLFSCPNTQGVFTYTSQANEISRKFCQ